jgi:hypothetical protein
MRSTAGSGFAREWTLFDAQYSPAQATCRPAGSSSVADDETVRPPAALSGTRVRSSLPDVPASAGVHASRDPRAVHVRSGAPISVTACPEPGEV